MLYNYILRFNWFELLVKEVNKDKWKQGKFYEKKK